MGQRHGLATTSLPPDGVDRLRKLVGEAQRLLADDQGAVTLRVVRDELTPRQLDVLRLMADGLTSPEIAKKLWLSDQTVKFHKREMYSALGVSNAAHAVSVAIREGIIE